MTTRAISILGLLAALVAVPSPAAAAWTVFGVASTPADTGTNATTTITVTPPSSMTAGDLVYVTVLQRGTATFSVGVDGGQAWNTLSRHTATNLAQQAFWARFNGTWSADPRFDVSAGTNTTALMVVFRPTSTTKLLAVDTAEATGAHSGCTSGCTITGHTRVNSSCVTIGVWTGTDDNTWGTLTGTGWAQTSLGAQYRNLAGSDTSISLAYNIGSGATNSPSLTQTANGPDSGRTAIISFYEYDSTRRAVVIGTP